MVDDIAQREEMRTRRSGTCFECGSLAFGQPASQRDVARDDMI